MESYSDWDNWKNMIKNAVTMGKTVGMEDETIAGIGAKIGDILEERFDPENPQQRVIKEMWEVGNEEEQRCMANLIMKMVTRDKNKGKEQKKEQEKEKVGNRT